MIKLRFDRNRSHTAKAEDQKVVSPIEKELNEQELAAVTGGWRGGWGGGRWGGGWGGGWGGWGGGWGGCGGWGCGCW